MLTTTVGSYPVPDWLAALPSEQALLDATRVVFDLQRQARIDLPTDGELYRFDVNHPHTNGMIEYFIRPQGGGGAEAASVAGGDFKFTVTSPYMLARTLLDRHYGRFEELLMTIAEVLAGQVAGLPCACLQVD